MAGPSGLLRLLARTLIRGPGREFVLGDLHELHARRVGRVGRGAADRRFLRDVVASAAHRALPRLGLRVPGRPGRGPEGARPSPVPRPPGGGPLSVLSDASSAVRTFRRDKGFVALTVLTLALGVGSTAAVFGMVNQLLLRPLPGVTDPDGAAYLRLRSRSRPDWTMGQGLSTPDFDELRRQATLLEGVGSYGRMALRVSAGEGRPIAVLGNTVYGDYFEVLGVRPAEGRLLGAGDTELDADPTLAVMSQHLRATLFGPSDQVVGRTTRVNGRSVRVIGVAAEGFRGAERGDDIDLWLPYASLVPLLDFPPETLRSRDAVMHSDLVARPRPGAGPDAVTAQLDDILARLTAATDPEQRDYLSDLRAEIVPGLWAPPVWRDRTVETLRVMGLVVGLVLLIACANVANLLLFRNVKRRGDVATLRALGASPGRVARQALVESLLLAGAGTVGGLAVAWLVARLFRGESLLRMPAFEGFTLDHRVLAFAAAVAVLTALLFGALPAALAGRFDLAAALRDAGGRETGRPSPLRSALASAQVALSLSLLVGALLLVRTIHNLYAVDTGLSIDDVWAFYLEAPRGMEGVALDQLHRELVAEVTDVPGVDGAALDMYGPHGSQFIGRIGLPGQERAEFAPGTAFPVTPGWFELLGVRPVAGRVLRDPDWGLGVPGRVVLTASLARRLFGEADPVGRTVEVAFREVDEMEVVGVVGDIRHAARPDRPLDAFFVPYQDAPSRSLLTLLVRAPDDPGALRRVQRVVETLLPDEPVPDPVSLASRVDEIHAERRVLSHLLELLSAFAVLLSAVGLYGVVAFSVAGRRKEFGIRLALGARGRRIAGLVARYAVGVVGTGIVLGLAGAGLLSRVLESRLFGVEPMDPVSWGAAALLFVAVAAVACWVPARAAVRVDPVTTLKEP